jgi:hypothetical protein
MNIRSFGGRRVHSWGATVAVLLLALPLAMPTAAQAQRRGPSQHMQREAPMANPQRQPSPSFHAGQPHGAAHAQVRSEFRTVLEPHGRWQQHARWGEVWLPANRPRDWRPYTVGRWVYTDDWGWYWVSGDAEASWGWVAYHYGRWVFDDEFGWVWVPDDEWSPAWVQWRRPPQGLDYVGWAPLPPDDVIVDYVDTPSFWIFVRGRDFIAPRVASVILPVNRYAAFIRDTVIVNRTVPVGGGAGFAVNPGISPDFIAGATRQPLRTYDVRPVVLAGTAAIVGAMQLRAQDLRGRDFRPQVALRPTQNLVRAAPRVQPAQPLAAGGPGRLGDRPPRAAQRAGEQPSTTGHAPGNRQQALPQQRGQPQASPQQQGRQRQVPQPQVQQPEPQPQQAAPQRGRAKQQPEQTQGRGGEPQQRVMQPPQQAAPPRQGPTAQQRQQAPAAENRGAARQQQRERHAAPQGQHQQPMAQPQQRQQSQVGRSAPAPHAPPSTEGRGHNAPAQHAAPPQPQRAAPQPHAAPQPPSTVGRGGGGAPQAAAPPAGRAPGGGGAPGGGRGPGGPGGGHGGGHGGPH